MELAPLLVGRKLSRCQFHFSHAVNAVRNFLSPEIKSLSLHIVSYGVKFGYPRWSREKILSCFRSNRMRRTEALRNL